MEEWPVVFKEKVEPIKASPTMRRIKMVGTRTTIGCAAVSPL